MLFKNSAPTNSINVNVIKTTKEIITDEKFRDEHLKMAHLNSQDLATLLRSKGFKIENKTINNFTCDECLKSKSTVILLFKSKALCVAVEIGLFASDVLSTLPRPTILFVIPPTVPVNVGEARVAFRFNEAST